MMATICSARLLSTRLLSTRARAMAFGLSRARSLGRALALAAALAPCAASAQTAQDFCGQPVQEPAALLDAATKIAGIKQIHDGPEYFAYQDPATETVYTFTRQAQGQAHPSAVCRKPVKDGDNIKLQMGIVCRGNSDGCSRLESEFKKLNAQMEAHIRGQAGLSAPKPQ